MSQLPFLLRLMDDASPRVRAKVAAELRLLGAGVWREIEAQNLVLCEEQKRLLETILNEEARSPDAILRSRWRGLQHISDEIEFLEAALLALSQWQNGAIPAYGTALLDEIATEFLETQFPRTATGLSHFLFEIRGLQGADPDNYYEPLHSNFVHALEGGGALPITLACVFILVGARVGIRIEGCNFPGHFLARDARRQIVFDPYNGGKILSPHEVDLLQKAAPSEMSAPATSREIISRVLRNLSVAFHREGQTEKSGFILSLLRAMDGD